MTAGTKAAAIGAAAVVLAALIALIPTYWKPGPAPRTVSGVVSDCRGPLKDTIALVRTAQGAQIASGTTDSKGDFTVSVPADATGLVLEITKSGYESGTFRLPSTSDRQPFELKQKPMTFGISEGTALDGALSYVAGRLNVTARFSTKCAPRAQTASLSPVTDLAADALCQPQVALQALVDRVKTPGFRYQVNELQSGRLYEVVCFSR